MILVLLNTNGILQLKECKTTEEATSTATQWIAEANKIFPNKKFAPKYYVPAVINKKEES
jgi:hypothetical protein